MPFNDALDHRQPDAGAFEILDRMQALKHAEQLVGISGIEAGAVVAHAERQFPVASLSADFDPRRDKFVSRP